jgi:hypothetical protein
MVGFAPMSSDISNTQQRITWAKQSILIVEYAEPIVNVRGDEEIALAKRLYGGQTVYMFPLKLEPLQETRDGSTAMRQYHQIAAVQRIPKSGIVSTAQSHFLVCTNVGPYKVSKTSVFRNPSAYFSCRAPATKKEIVNVGDYGIDTSRDSIDGGVDGNWGNCCYLGDVGMDGAPLYRMVYPDNQQVSEEVAFISGILTYREAGKSNPDFDDFGFGDMYSAINKDVGKWINKQIGRFNEWDRE